MLVAIAGYGDLTRYICEEFAKAGHELLILTRTHKPQLQEQAVAQYVTDYTLSSLQAPLADREVLISTISDVSMAYTDIHRNLIMACQESPSCKRFIPAEFAANIEAFPDQPGFYYSPHEPIRKLLREQKDLEWTLVCVGWLADYLVPVKNRYIKDIGAFHPVNWGEHEFVIPGTGTEPVDFTWARDVARGLASLIEAPRGSWEPYTFMAGERKCWNAVVELVQQKFCPQVLIRHISLHTTVQMVKAAKDDNTLMLADYYLLSMSHACASPPDKVQAHKEKYFPAIHFRTLREGFLQHDEHPDSVL
ncbi:NAD(P)-binding protein [Tothia fuscella]|uniref:NAD(P)-binding protein n=1 Tax=Tothia fuscella TaxID=1048955 RepID=A0A9P4TZC9_9PEZI|nr:NAD(P)-binding protein [Tothia fuscella]